MDRCIAAGFVKTADDVRLSAARYLAGKRRVTPPGTARRKREALERARLFNNHPEELTQAVDQVVSINAKSIRQYKEGNEKAVNALIGQVMRLYKTDAQVIKDLLVRRIQT